MAKENFVDLKTSTKQVKINDLTGWELSINEKNPYSNLRRILYFPNGEYELIVREYYDQNTTKDAIINSLKIVK